MKSTVAIAIALLHVALPVPRGENASAEAANHWAFQIGAVYAETSFNHAAKGLDFINYGH
jgi:hypothetical protein